MLQAVLKNLFSERLSAVLSEFIGFNPILPGGREEGAGEVGGMGHICINKQTCSF